MYDNTKFKPTLACQIKYLIFNINTLLFNNPKRLNSSSMWKFDMKLS